MVEAIYWLGTEDQEHKARMKACKDRRKEHGNKSCAEKDGSCSECEHDMALALQVTKAVFDRAVENGEIDPL